MADLNSGFLKLWRNEKIRSRLISYTNDDSLCALRLASSDCCALATKPLFTRTRLTFTPSALSRPSRVEALARIGHHIEHLTFSMPHTESTFLPPLLNPTTGREVNFLYTPHTSLASEVQRPKYGTQELGDLLTQQYPSIFHAATDVPAFIRALSCMPNLRHLTVTCPGQESTERYRRSAVDYALISLRIAIERACLPYLAKLSLDVHPAALLYLHPTPSFGACPAALRRWRQIRNLKLTIDSWPFESSPTDHLMLLLAYMRTFSSTVEKLSFAWNGRRGPCPLTLGPNASNGKPSSPRTNKLFAEITSPMSPLPDTPPPPPLFFPLLRRLNVCNSRVAAHQVSHLLTAHRATIRSLDLNNVTLSSGTWEEALKPLEEMGGRHGTWHSRHSGSGISTESLSGSSGPSRDNSDEDGDEHSDGREHGEDEYLGDNHPLNTHVAKRRVRRHRHRRARTPSPPPPVLKHQGSSFFQRLKDSAVATSQSNFFTKFMHKDEGANQVIISDPVPIAPSSIPHLPMPKLKLLIPKLQESAVFPTEVQEEFKLPATVYTAPAKSSSPVRRTPSPLEARSRTNSNTSLHSNTSSSSSLRNPHNRSPPPIPEQHSPSRTPSPRRVNPKNRTPPPIPDEYRQPHLPSPALPPKPLNIPFRHPATPPPSPPARGKFEHSPPRPPPLHPLRTNPPTPTSPTHPLMSGALGHVQEAPGHPKRHGGAMQLDPNIQGVQRNFALENQQQVLVDDVERRMSALRHAREAVLARLGGRFCRDGSARDRDAKGAAHAAKKDGNEIPILGKAVYKPPVMKAGGSGVRAGEGRMGMGMQQGMLVPLMIFR